MKYFSLFSGIGGFELGIQQAYEHISDSKGKKQGRIPQNISDTKQSLLAEQQPACIGFSEIDKYATQIYQQHFPQNKNYGNITKINASTLPDFDFLCGGFPCQSFSIAGKRGGFEDTRGTLFFEIARILKAKQPRIFLLENVKGLLSHDNGQTFKTIVSTLTELGYDLQWQVLNSKNFGVPQNRERVFIIGHLRGTSRPQVFPFTSHDRKIDELPRHITNTLTARYEGAQATGTYVSESKFNAQKTKSSRQGVFKEGDKPNDSNSRRGSAHTSNIRRLTPTECERLQGFPDNWTAGVSDTQRYKTLGNAVTVNVIRAIMEKLC